MYNYYVIKVDSSYVKSRETLIKNIFHTAQIVLNMLLHIESVEETQSQYVGDNGMVLHKYRKMAMLKSSQLS